VILRTEGCSSTSSRSLDAGARLALLRAAVHTLYTTHPDACARIVAHARARGLPRGTSIPSPETSAERRASSMATARPTGSRRGEAAEADQRLAEDGADSISPMSSSSRSARAPRVHLADRATPELARRAACCGAGRLLPALEPVSSTKLPPLLSARKGRHHLPAALGNRLVSRRRVARVLAEARAQSPIASRRLPSAERP